MPLCGVIAFARKTHAIRWGSGSLLNDRSEVEEERCEGLLVEITALGARERGQGTSRFRRAHGDRGAELVGECDENGFTGVVLVLEGVEKSSDNGS